MKRLASAILLLLAPYLLSGQAGHKPDPNVDIIHYEFNIDLNDSTDIIRGYTAAEISFTGPVNSFSLDLKGTDKSGKGMIVSEVVFNGSKIKWEHTGNRLTVYAQEKAGDHGKVEVTYAGIPADGLIISRNRFGDRTFFADHWPDRACCYLPVVDYPSDKATVNFSITAPSHYMVVASGYLTEESDIDKGRKLTRWEEDVPLPVKVMTFAAAPFATELAGKVNDIPVWTWVFPQNRKEGFNDYKLAVKPLKFYSDLIGPYSYEKLANVQSKTIFGGLENAGTIFYYENSVTGQGKAEDLIAHEVAHQWFGNSVTEKEWHHIWLSEGFATYLAAVYREMNYGEAELAPIMSSDRERVLRSSGRNSGPVIDTTITNLMRLLSVNSYQKGSWVLHMLRYKVGDKNFWNGMRLYYTRYRNGNALTDDFRKCMEETSDRNLEEFFHQWLYTTGQPDLKITTAAGQKKGTKVITIEQAQESSFTFDIEIGISDSGGKRKVTIPVSKKITTITVKADENAEITPDPDVRLLFRNVTSK